MGRPEKAKLRKLIGSPNMLFPIGQEGGRLRSLQAACEEGKVSAEFPLYFCENCNKKTIYPICENCNKKTKKIFYSLYLDKEVDSIDEKSKEEHFQQFKLKKFLLIII
jgi:hypothetical protein